jgi:hypothetical protein
METAGFTSILSSSVLCVAKQKSPGQQVPQNKQVDLKPHVINTNALRSAAYCQVGKLFGTQPVYAKKPT